MTKLQMIFLIVTVVYLMAKGVLFFLIYLVTLQIEKAALERQHRMRRYLASVRAQDKERYKEAYQWYEKRKPKEEVYPKEVPNETNELPLETTILVPVCDVRLSPVP